MEFKDLIKVRRLQLGKTLEEIGKSVGVSKATVQRWESGEIKNVRRDKIGKLSNALDVSPDYLMGWEEKPANQKSIFEYENIIPLPKTYKVPLIGDIACGVPILAEENIIDYIELSENIHADFCLRCHGDSMINARIFDGDIVFIKSQNDVDDGQIAVVLVGEEATLKRVRKYNHKIVLYPENDTMEPFVYSGDELENIRIQGLAVAFLSAVR